MLIKVLKQTNVHFKRTIKMLICVNIVLIFKVGLKEVSKKKIWKFFDKIFHNNFINRIKPDGIQATYLKLISFQ